MLQQPTINTGYWFGRSPISVVLIHTVYYTVTETHTHKHTKPLFQFPLMWVQSIQSFVCVCICVGAACISISVVSSLAQKGTDTHPTHILSAAQLHKLQCVKALTLAELKYSALLRGGTACYCTFFYWLWETLQSPFCLQASLSPSLHSHSSF